MDMIKIVREIGFFEAGYNLLEVLESADIRDKAGAVMPLPERGLRENISRLSDWLISFGKSKYMFISPEINLIENLAIKSEGCNAFILIPCDMEKETEERLSNNLPKSMGVGVVHEPYFLKGFLPCNGIIVVCGYEAGNRLMVLPETYRMVERYSREFKGKTVFIPYVSLATAMRYNGWIEVAADRFSDIWRENYE